MELVKALERAQTEVRAGRKYVDGLKESLASKQKLIEQLNDRDAVRVKAQESLQAEVRDLQSAIKSQEKNLKIKGDEIEYLKKDSGKHSGKFRRRVNRQKYSR